MMVLRKSNALAKPVIHLQRSWRDLGSSVLVLAGQPFDLRHVPSPHVQHEGVWAGPFGWPFPPHHPETLCLKLVLVPCVRTTGFMRTSEGPVSVPASR